MIMAKAGKGAGHCSPIFANFACVAPLPSGTHLFACAMNPIDPGRSIGACLELVGTGIQKDANIYHI